MAASVAAEVVGFIDGESINGDGLRLAQSAALGGGATATAVRGGVRPSGGEPGLVQALPTPAMKTRVNPGIYVVPRTGGGAYVVAVKIQADLDHDNSGSFPRTDLTIVEVVDTGTSASTAQLRVLKGPTDSPGAARPSNTTPNAHYIVTGSVDVRVGAESSGNIRTQDVHPERPWAVAAGAPVPVDDEDERDALTQYDGLQVYRRDTGAFEVSDGSAFAFSGGRQQRVWEFPRSSSNVEDSWTSTGFVGVALGTIADAPAGDYTITFNTVVSSSTVAAGQMRVTAGAVTRTIRQDLFAQPILRAMTVPVTHAGGSLALLVEHSAAAGTTYVQRDGTTIVVAYHGAR